MDLRQAFSPNVNKIIIFIIVASIISVLAVSISGAGMIPPVGSFILYPVIYVVFGFPLLVYSFLSKSLPETFAIPLSWLLGLAYIYILFCFIFYIYDKVRELWKEKLTAKLVIIGLILGLVIIIIAKIPADIERVERAKSRGPAPDARITADLSEVRGIAETIQGEEGSYTGLCDDSNTLNDNHPAYGAKLQTLENDITEKGPEGTGKPICFATDKSYCVSARLNYGGMKGEGYYCIDGTGSAKYTNNPCTSTNKCPD